MTTFPENQLFFENAYDAYDSSDRAKFVSLINNNSQGKTFKLRIGDCIKLPDGNHEITNIVDDDSRGEPECIYIELDNSTELKSDDPLLKELSLCSTIKGGKKKKTKRRKSKRKTKRR